MFWPFGQPLDHPGVIKGNIGFPGLYAGLGKKLCKTERGKKNDKGTNKVDNE